MAEARGMTIVRSGDTSILFRAVLFDGANVKITAGSTTLRLWRVISSTGALETYDFNDNTFKAGAITTPTVAMTHRQAENSTYNTGVWTYRHSTLTGFTEAYIGEKYIVEVSHASLVRPITMEFQYGDLEGDESMYLPIVRGRNTAQASAAGYIALDASASAVDDFYQGMFVTIIGGTGVGQSRRIVTYTQTNKRAYVAPAWTTTPDTTSIFIVNGNPNGRMLFEHAGLAQAGAAGSITLATTASTTVNIYKGMFVRIMSGTGTGQCRYINDYTAGRVAAVTPNWATTPDATSVYEVLPAESVWDELQSQHVASLSTGNNLNVLGTAIAARANNANLNALLGVADVASHDVPWEVWDELITAAAHATATSAGARLYGAPSAMIRENTVAAGGNNSVQLDAGASAIDQFYRGCDVVITAGTGVGQLRKIIHYVGGTKTAYVDRDWVTNPAAAATFQVIGAPGRGMANTGLAQAGAAATITLATSASGTSNIYNGQTVRIASGLGAGQSRVIIAYDGGTKIATVSRNWDTNPDATSGYELLATTDSYGQSDIIWDEDILSAHGTASTSGLVLRALNLTSRAVGFNTLNGILGVPDAVGATVCGQTWEELLASHNTPNTMGAVMNVLSTLSLTTIADAVWDELMAGHIIANSAGLILGALDLTTRANTPTLNGLLGVPDSAGVNLVDAIWDETLNINHGGANAAGLYLRALAMDIANRANKPSLGQLLAVQDVPNATIAWTVLDELVDGTHHTTPNTAGERLGRIDELTRVGGAGDLTLNLVQTLKMDATPLSGTPDANSVAGKLNAALALLAIMDKQVIVAVNLESTTLHIEVAVEQYGIIQTAPWTRCRAEIYDENNVFILGGNIGYGQFGAIGARGFFMVNINPHGMVAGKTYQIKAFVDDAGVNSISTTKPITVFSG